MKDFLKTVGMLFITVLLTTVAVLAFIKYAGEKVLPQTFDSSVSTAQVEDNSFELNSLVDVFTLRQMMIDENRTDSTFLAMDDGPLSNVVAVLLKRGLPITKSDIVNEYLAERSVYDNLPPAPKVEPSTATTSADPLASLTLQQEGNTTVTEAPPTGVGDKESPPSKDTVINGKRYKPVNQRIMKRAIVIVYDGEEAKPGVLAALIAALCEYQVITNPDVKPDAYNLDESEIAQAIVGKAMNFQNVDSHVSDKYEHAVSIVCEPFMKEIKDGDFDAFTIELASTLRDCINENNARSTQFRDAVKIIAEEGSEAYLSPSFMFNHGLSNRLIQIIRRTRDIVCQGHHITIQ